MYCPSIFFFNLFSLVVVHQSPLKYTLHLKGRPLKTGDVKREMKQWDALRGCETFHQEGKLIKLRKQTIQ